MLLTKQLSALSTHVTAMALALNSLFDLRTRAISVGPGFPATDLATLSAQTSALSEKLSSLPAAFTLTAQRLLRLESLSVLNQIAALESELITSREQFAATSLEAKQTIVERIRSEAWEEVDARDSAWRRCEERIASENPALGVDEVRRAVQAAFEGASNSKVADLDVSTLARYSA